MPMKAHLVHTDEMRFRAQADNAPAILLDGGDRPTGRGPSPMQAALLAALGCTASDVVWILKKERVPFTSFEIDAEAERAEDDPRVFTKIRMHYRLHGSGIRESAVRRAIELSSETYCSVGIMLRRAGVEFVNTVEIVPEG